MLNSTSVELKTLDELPLWTMWVLAIGVVGICIFGTTVSFIRSKRQIRSSTTLRDVIGSMSPTLFFAITGAIVLWFFITLMFFRLRTVAIGSKDVELRYFWPRSPVTINLAELEMVKLIPSRRGGGYVEFVTHENVFQSASFRHSEVAKEIQDILKGRGVRVQ